MSESPADEILAEIRAIRRLTWSMRPLSRVDPHAFVEDKDAIARRLDKLETQFRVRFGGTPAKFRVGTIQGPTGHPVSVERRRSA